MYNNLKKTSDKSSSASRDTSPRSSFPKEHATQPKHHSGRSSPGKSSPNKPAPSIYLTKPNQTIDQHISEHSQSLSTVLETDTEESLTTDTSVGIPPKSLTYMRDNLRNIIGMMGDDKNTNVPGTPTSQDVSVLSSDVCMPCYNNAASSSCCQPKELATPPKELATSPKENRYVETVYCTDNVMQQGTGYRGHSDVRESVEEPRDVDVREPRICSRSRLQVNRHSPPPQYEAEACENQCGRCLAPNVPSLGLSGPDVRSCTCVAQGAEVVRGDEAPCPCACESGPDSPCVAKRTATEKIKDLYNRMVGNNNDNNNNNKLQYTFNLNNEHAQPPRRLIFDLVEGIPAPPGENNHQLSMPLGGDKLAPAKKKEKSSKKKEVIKKTYESSNNEKVEIYYFDHGNSGYYRTTDNPPALITDDFFEQTDLYATRFWAEIFGTLHIGIAFVTALILQFIRFILYSIVRPLTIGVIQLTSDYFFKPLLSILFNGVLQPVLILAYNTATSIRDLCEPIAQGFGFFVRVIAELFRAFRLVEVNTACKAHRGGSGCPARSV